MAKVINDAYTDAQAVNESSLTTYTYRDLSLFFTQNPVTGDVATLTDVSDIKRAVRNLVLTNEFDRPFHPEIASHVRDLLFQPFSVITYNLVKERIEKVIELFEPRVTLTRIVIEDEAFSAKEQKTHYKKMDNNIMAITIYFTLKNAPTNEESVDIMLERIR